MNSPSSPGLLFYTSSSQLDPDVVEVLARCNCSAQLATDDTQALELLLGSNAPDILLLDGRVSVGTSLRIAAEVRARRNNSQIWIILLTGSADPSTVAASAAAGIDDMLLCRAGQPVGEIDLPVRLGVAARVQQITRQLVTYAESNSLASHDQLTGLPNRESLLGMLFTETDRVQRTSTPLSFLLLDLDHFSRINEDFGYETGNKVLQELASRLRRYMRSYDLIGRCNADDFLIALPGCNSSRALHLATRIRTILLHRPFGTMQGQVTLTASIGLAQSRGRSPLVVLREAERALASAKNEGRNCEREYVSPPQRHAKK